jgi:hypothetical protein
VARPIFLAKFFCLVANMDDAGHGSLSYYLPQLERERADGRNYIKKKLTYSLSKLSIDGF